MKKIGNAFENFAFKAFDFSGRASVLEYWLLMPLVWAVILFLAYGDLVEFWEFLLRREVPPLNPLYWDAIVIFLITMIPRLSLTVRRLHDSGKSGKWAKLPFLSFFFSIWLVLGLLSALPSLAVGGGGGEAIAIFSIALMVFTGATDSLWQIIFGAAAVLNQMGWDAIWATLAEVSAKAPKVDASQAISNVSRGLQEAPAQSGSLLFILMLWIAAPFVTLFLHFFFMILPGKLDHELENTGLISGASLRIKGDVSENPFAGYKYLYAKSEEERAAEKVQAREEIKSLYKQRVLGQQSAS